MKANDRSELRARRHRRIRRKISGSSACPRLAVMISNRYLYAQMIDDTVGTTLVSARAGGVESVTVDRARALGQHIGEQAREKGISRFVVDRGGFRFHGRVKALVEGAEAAGLSSKKEEQ